MYINALLFTEAACLIPSKVYHTMMSKRTAVCNESQSPKIHTEHAKTMSRRKTNSKVQQREREEHVGGLGTGGDKGQYRMKLKIVNESLNMGIKVVGC